MMRIFCWFQLSVQILFSPLQCHSESLLHIHKFYHLSVHKPSPFSVLLSLILMIVGMEVLLLLQSYKIDSRKNLRYGFLQLCLCSINQSIWLNENVMSEREAIVYRIGCFFTHCVKGGGGGSNPCVKIYVADLYNSGGLLAT